MTVVTSGVVVKNRVYSMGRRYKWEVTWSYAESIQHILFTTSPLAAIILSVRNNIQNFWECLIAANNSQVMLNWYVFE